MDHKTEKYLGTLLLRMAADARQEGDLVTALLVAHAMDYFDEAAQGQIHSTTCEGFWR